MQGEGPYVGFRQIFIRFSGCNLSCAYCDTGELKEGADCRIEVDPGRRLFTGMSNPLTVGEIVDALKERFPAVLHHSASITGGEPLLQAEFLKDMLPALNGLGYKVYLETNGSLPEKLSQVINHVDIISMDIKLPGTSGCAPLWDRHHQFLSLARRVEVFVKIVMDDLSPVEEYKRALDLVSGIDPGITVILQPLTRAGRCALSPGRALKLQEMGLEILKDIRIIPQAHIMMNQL